MENDLISVSYRDRDGKWKALPSYESAVHNGRLFAGLCFVAGYAFGVVSLILLILVSVAMAGEVTTKSDNPGCVDQHEIVAAMKSLINIAEPKQTNVTLSVCNTCECWFSSSIGSSEYYKCKAAEADREKKYFKEKHELVERIEESGVCYR